MINQIGSVGRVLYVDADSNARRALKKSLCLAGLEVYLAADTVQAIRLAQRWEFSVIIVDQGTVNERIDGLIRRIRPLHPKVTFLLATDGESIHAGSTTVQGMVAATLRKPWDDQEAVKVVEQAVALRNSRVESQTKGAAATLRVLLVEDSLADAFLIEEALATSEPRHEVVVAYTLAQGLDAIHTDSFDVILSDLTLPDARGLDAVRRLCTAAPEAALLVLSGLEDDELGVQAVQLGAQDYLVKGGASLGGIQRSIRYAVERKRAEQRLFHMAHFDQLTGLANRTTFRDRLSHALARARRNNATFAVLFVDLDGFKSVNDTHGHEAGDELLREVSHRFRKCLRDSDTLARLGGDEFAILLEDVGTNAELLTAASRLVSSLSRAIELNGATVKSSCSVGGASYPHDGETIDAILGQADGAMYAAKRGGHGRIRFARRPPNHHTPRTDLLEFLANALELNQFHLVYQPQFDTQTRQVVGFEALMRCRREDELVPPTVFIPILEEMGLITEVGEWVLMQACEQLATWHGRGHRNLRMAVNLSAHQFEDEHLVGSVVAALQTYGLPPTALELEITEGILMADTDRTHRILDTLKEMGVRIAIDDFGTGYSSLAYLHRLSADVLKIDRSLIASLTDDVDALTIVQALIGLGTKLNLEVVAEGVETEAQMQILADHRCRLVQGYLLGRPRADWDDLLVTVHDESVALTSLAIRQAV